MPTLKTEKRASEMIHLLDQYQEQHSADAFHHESSENICNRRQYIAIENVQCDSIGNSFGKFLHSLVVAVLFNRTVILHGSNHCRHLLAYQLWIGNNRN